MILLFLFLYIPFLLAQKPKDIISEYLNPSKEYEFSRMVLNPKSGDIFLAGINYLYRLKGADLTPALILKTGPKESADQCYLSASEATPDSVVFAALGPGSSPSPPTISSGGGSNACLGHTLHMEPYVNQALLYDPARDIIIDCQTLFRGACLLRDPHTLSSRRVPIASLTRTTDPALYPTTLFTGKVPTLPSPCLALLTSPPLNSSTLTPQNLMLVSAGAPLFRGYYLALYALDPPSSIFNFRTRALHGLSALGFMKEARRAVHAYTYDAPEYVYVALKRKIKTSAAASASPASPYKAAEGLLLGEGEEESILSRACLTHPSLKSYSELGLGCGAGPRALLTSARVTLAGGKMGGGGRILLAAFTLPGNPRHRNALCIYRLDEIHAAFDSALHPLATDIFVYKITESVNAKLTESSKPPVDEFAKTVKSYVHDACLSTGFITENAENDPKITASPVITFDGDQGSITAINSDVVEEHTIAFLGTGDGRIIKVLINSFTSASIYAEFKVARGYGILPELEFGPDRSFIYGLTQEKVFKMRVHTCEVYGDCKSCLSSKDVYCGWCNHDNKCKTRADCEASYDRTKGPSTYLNTGGTQENFESWVSYDTGQCSIITWLNPSEIQITTLRNIRLVINYLPSGLSTVLAPSTEYACVFTAFGSSVETRAKRISLPQGVRRGEALGCRSPDLSQLSSIPYGKNSYSAILSVKKLGGPEFTYTNFTVYDCTSYRSCVECTSSPYQCHWCVKNNMCTPDVDQDCRGDYLINGLKVMGATSRPGPEFCPYLVIMDPKPIIQYSAGKLGPTPSIIVHAERNLDLKMKAFNVQRFMIQERSFTCQFNQNGKIMTRNGRFNESNNVLTCDSVGFYYASSVANVTVTFGVLWSAEKMLDGPFAPTAQGYSFPTSTTTTGSVILVYKCASLAHDCGRCMLLSNALGCSWCENSCSIHEQCFGNWLERNTTCPDPIITSFSPTTGPYEGGTDLTIKGLNLGREISDFLQGITVAGIPCNPYTHRYVPTTEIVCKVERSGKEITGPLIINVGRYTGRSASNFAFVNFMVTDVMPKFGAKAGGTRVTLTGHHLDAGNTAQVNLAGHACIVLTRSPNATLCLTTPHREASAPPSGPVIYGIDGTFREGLMAGSSRPRLIFEYVDNPRIMKVDTPAGIMSGGIRIDVTGVRLDNVQEAFILITVHRVNLTAPCEIVSAASMTCPSPRVSGSPELATLGVGVAPESVDKSTPSVFVASSYGFVLDGTFYHVTPQSSDSTASTSFVLYPDPVVKPFAPPDHVKYYRAGGSGDYLSVEVGNACPICRERDFAVTVGGLPCDVTSVSERILNCVPPAAEHVLAAVSSASRVGRSRDRVGVAEAVPSPADGDPAQYLVRVWVGDNLITDVGYLRYGDINPASGVAGLTTTGIASITASVLALLLATLAVFLFYRRKSNQNSRALKNMQEQMTILESQVAQECKAAFAELQTDMTELTNDLTGVGIPLLDYRTYCMKVLFPNAVDHPILHDNFTLDPLQKNKEKGLKLFEQLLSFKTFLLLFIQTLENDRYFSMRDRVNVASLIMVALQGKLDYCTDILKTLLAELIERSMDGNSHPKLLLRRTESVAEKMLTAWFTFLLHRFLKECAGEPLFLLFRAIKQQADKGPIDQITSEAKYSLSEEKLLRCHVEYEIMTIHAIVPDPDTMGNSLDVYVKALDVDTITQVKDKILDTTFKNFPQSLRPNAKDLDLEWRTGLHGRVILRDEDITSHIDGEWKRLNTLKHYKVPNEATLVLIRASAVSSSASQSCVSSLSLSLMGGGAGENCNQHRYQQLHNNGGGNNVYNWKDRFPLESSNVQSPFSSSRNTASISHGSGKNRPAITHYGMESSANSSSNLKLWHLVKHYDTEPKEEMGNKMMSEIYLTRLLATKGTLQKFVDDLFDTIFSTSQRSSSLPLAIKFMFDFLDDQAFQHQITDSEVVHTWKSNSLPLRFWVNLIKNPNFIFDVHKSNTVDACLSVVAQTFMDSCSTSDQRLGKDSPSSKLLYAKDIVVYKEWVERYYQDIRMMSPITEQDMLAFLAEESSSHAKDFNTRAALWELYRYVENYNVQLLTALNADEIGKKKKLAQRLQSLHSVMKGEI